MGMKLKAKNVRHFPTSGVIQLVLWGYTSHLSEMTQSCGCFIFCIYLFIYLFAVTPIWVKAKYIGKEKTKTKQADKA